VDLVTIAVNRRPDAWEVGWETEHANALSVALVERLHDLLDEALREQVPALVLRGGATHFASGFDLSGADELSDAELAHRFLRIGLLLDRLARAPFLTVAMASGAAIGAGADLVAVCDRRLALASATFAFPGSQFGVVLGTHRLAAVVGHDRAVRLVGGRRVGAVDTGLVEVYDELASMEAVLDSQLRGWARIQPSARPALLEAARPQHDDAALAALARSVLRPGLAQWIRAFTPGGPEPDVTAEPSLSPDLKESA
jgi:enoyl-CoA hydratase